MADLPFNQQIMDWFLENRIDWLTDIFIVFTILGNEEGYILIVAGLYWLYDKKTAIKLAMVIIVSGLLNHIIKIIIRNPRPYYEEGTYQDKWAIPESDIEDTADSFSTPSGHAMGSSSFWTYLHLKIKSRLTFVLFPLMILFIGLSRPYLGVHFLEDVIIGWIIGILVVVLIIRVEDNIATQWNSLNQNSKYIIIIFGPLITIILAGIIGGYNPDTEPFATFGGLFTGLLGGIMLEKSKLDFEPILSQYEGLLTKVGIGLIRYTIGIILVFVTLEGLDLLFTEIAEDESFVGFILRYIRYSTVGIVAAFLAPLTFVSLRLGKTKLEN